MPGITHTQPAQPTTLAHHLLGVIGPLERDSERLRQAYARVNCPPLRAAAFTTTSSPIDRTLTAQLLGCDGFVENGYDAVGASDFMLEATQTLVTLAASLSRFVYDLLIWARAEASVLRIHDEFVQNSSIMPQKLNPIVLEHVRARVSYVYGEAAAVATMIHSAAFGDTVDVEDPNYVPITRAFDALVRDHGLPFRTVHRIVSGLVKQGTGAIDAGAVAAATERVLGHALTIDDDWLEATLDPRRFVESRDLPGGPAPSATAVAISAARGGLRHDRLHTADAERQLNGSTNERARRIDTILL